MLNLILKFMNNKKVRVEKRWRRRGKFTKPF